MKQSSPSALKPIRLNYGTSGSSRNSTHWDTSPANFSMAPSLPQFSAARMRSYVFRLPLFTRGIMFVIVMLWIIGFQSIWDVQQWGALIPDEIGISTSES